MSFLLKYYIKLQHKYQIATMGNFGRCEGEYMAFSITAIHFLSIINILQLFFKLLKIPCVQVSTFSFQEPTMSQAPPTKPWEGELLPGLWLCNDKGSSPFRHIYLLATSENRLRTKWAWRAIYPSAYRKCTEGLRWCLKWVKKFALPLCI